MTNPNTKTIIYFKKWKYDFIIQLTTFSYWSKKTMNQLQSPEEKIP